MKTHKIKYGGEFTADGWDDTFRTYCELTENCSEDMESQFVGRNDECSCKVCNKAYKKELEKYDKEHTS